MPRSEIWDNFKESARLFVATNRENPLFSERLNPSMAVFVPDSLTTLEEGQREALATHPLVQPVLHQIFGSRFFHNGATPDEQASIQGFAVSYTCLKNYLGRSSPTRKEGTLIGEGTGLPVVLAAAGAINVAEGAYVASVVDSNAAEIQRETAGDEATLIVRGEPLRENADIAQNRALFTEVINYLESAEVPFNFTRFLRDILELRISRIETYALLKELNSKEGVSAAIKNGIPRRFGRMDKIRLEASKAAKRIEWRKPRRYQLLDARGRRIIEQTDAREVIENFDVSRLDWFDPSIKEEMIRNGIRRTVNLPYELPNS